MSRSSESLVYQPGARGSSARGLQTSSSVASTYSFPAGYNIPGTASGSVVSEYCQPIGTVQSSDLASTVVPLPLSQTFIEYQQPPAAIVSYINPAVAHDYDEIDWSLHVRNTLVNGVPAWGSGIFDPRTAYCFMLLCFVGISGIQRVYLGQLPCAIGYCLTCGVCCFGNIYDLCMVQDLCKQQNLEIRRRLIEKRCPTTTVQDLFPQPVTFSNRGTVLKRSETQSLQQYNKNLERNKKSAGADGGSGSGTRTGSGASRRGTNSGSRNSTGGSGKVFPADGGGGGGGGGTVSGLSSPTPFSVTTGNAPSVLDGINPTAGGGDEAIFGTFSDVNRFGDLDY